MIFDLIYWILIFAAGVIGFLLSYEFLVLRFQQSYKTAKTLKGPKIYPLIGNFINILNLGPEAAYKFLRQSALNYKESYAFYFMGYLFVQVVRSQNELGQILSSTKHINKTWLYEFLHPFVGTGLLTSNGNKWSKRRKILTPAFHFNILQQQFHGIFKNETDLLVETLKQTSNNHDGLVLQDFIPRFTLNTICETAMGVKLNSLNEPNGYRRAIHEIGELIIYRTFRPWLYFKIFYLMALNYRAKFDKIALIAHTFTRNVIKERKKLFQTGKITTEFSFNENIYETKKVRHAMLDTLLASEIKGEIDDEGIAEEVDTFMFEGHDTTAAGLLGILLLLAHHPEAQEKIYEEIMQEIEKSNGTDLTMAQYANMKYFDRAIKECLRIYPPVPFIGRELHEQLIVNNRVYPAGTIFQIHIYDIHRDPKQFPDPEKFDPDRFLQENVEKRNSFSYIPFSAGPRNCIGQKFAMLELKTLITKIIWNFHILPITRREDVVFILDLVLRPSTPIKVKFQLRNKN